MKVKLLIRASDNVSPLAKVIDWKEEKALPIRGERHFIPELDAQVKVHGVCDLNTEVPTLIFVRDLDPHTTHRLQSQGWKREPA